jgi:hypothetical protein
MGEEEGRTILDLLGLRCSSISGDFSAFVASRSASDLGPLGPVRRGPRQRSINQNDWIARQGLRRSIVYRNRRVPYASQDR